MNFSLCSFAVAVANCFSALCSSLFRRANLGLLVHQLVHLDIDLRIRRHNCHGAIQIKRRGHLDLGGVGEPLEHGRALLEHIGLCRGDIELGAAARAPRSSRFCGCARRALPP